MKSQEIYKAVREVYSGRGLTASQFKLRLRAAGEIADGLSPKDAAGWIRNWDNIALLEDWANETKDFEKIKERLNKES